jgi:hypothetical protein
MAVIAILILLAPFALAFMILFPEDPEGRWGRFRRVIVAAAVFVAADAVCGAVRPLLEAMERPEEFGPLSAILWLISFAILTVPFAISERVAGLFGARRARPWALVGMLGGIAWAGAFAAFFWWLNSGAGLTWRGVLLDGAVAGVTGVAAGLAWYRQLPHRDGPDEIARLFE